MPASFRFHRHPKFRTIGCTVGVAPHVFVGAYGDSKASALAGASQVAAQLKQVFADNPALATLMQLTPGGAAAMLAISNSAEIIKAGGDVIDVAKHVGPNAAQVVTSILKLL